MTIERAGNGGVEPGGKGTCSEMRGEQGVTAWGLCAGPPMICGDSCWVRCGMGGYGEGGDEAGERAHEAQCGFKWGARLMGGACWSATRLGGV